MTYEIPSIYRKETKLDTQQFSASQLKAYGINSSGYTSISNSNESLG